jgi:signal transduction histidine kinase
VTTAPSAERDTVAVEEAPTDDGSHLPFTSVGGALRWWFGPSAGRDHWVAAWYLVVGVLWSVVMFTATLAALSVTFGLLFVVVGLFLVVPTFGLVDAMVSVERRRAEWIGRRIEPRTLRTSTGGWWPSIGTAVTDDERWRQVGFVMAFAVAAPVLFGVALVPWVMILVVVIRAISGLGGVDLLDVLVAVALLGVAPRITLVLARAAVTFVAWFLGRDATAELAGRVEELSVQRAEILEAVAAERRRIERNLHDGVQQQLVALGIDIGRAQARLDDDPEAARALLDEARQTLRAAIGEMRVIGRGLHPAVLEDRGLDAALSSIVAASPIPTSIDVAVSADLPDGVAATAYYVVSEAVANIHKHARARVASVAVTDGGPASIRIIVHDDGRGGADASHGTGLAGMKARVEGLDGTLRIDSPPGGPTTLEVVLPVLPLDPITVRRS